VADKPSASPDKPPRSLMQRIMHIILGAPRDLADSSIFRHLSLIPLLAWVGLGADGLSSSSYGPPEAFSTLFTPGGAHTYMAIGLALMTAITVIIISTAYSQIIAEFPHGGGGYVVATKLLGPRIGLVSGCALLVDYMLTITVSIAAAGEAIFDLLPPEMVHWKFTCELVTIGLLILLNIRGVKESVLVLAPIFMLFLLVHALLIGGGIILRAPHLPAMAAQSVEGFRGGLSTLGLWGMFILFAHAFSLGGGTYTGLEAVSNGLPIMREPRVRTARRTMIYMATSLSLCAGGLLLCYLLWEVVPVPGNTINYLLAVRVFAGWPLSSTLVATTMLSAGALLVVGAQAGFIDGPRVLANMAVDGWAPRLFSALSQRLTTRNGILLMGSASMLALIYTHGDVRSLVVMYSINVFLTFSLSMFAMLRLWFGRSGTVGRKRSLAIFGIGLALCLTILCITTVEKFTEGGWITLLATAGVVTVGILIRRHYTAVADQLTRLYQQLENIPTPPENVGAPTPQLDRKKPTAAILVGGYSGLGVHTVLNVLRQFPGQFRNIVFISAGVVDSGEFKGEGAVEALAKRTQESLERYEDLAHRLGLAATSVHGVGTDAVAEAERLCLQVVREFPQTTFFGGKLVFKNEKWYHRLLHNGTAFELFRRLQQEGYLMVIFPARV
jgi:amino acid transporter